MFGFLKKLFGAKPTVNPCEEAPYKVEAAPAPAVEAPKVEAKPVAETKPAPAKKTAPKKGAAPKKDSAGKGRGRKPKSKA